MLLLNWLHVFELLKLAIGKKLLISCMKMKSYLNNNYVTIINSTLKRHLDFMRERSIEMFDSVFFVLISYQCHKTRTTETELLVDVYFTELSIHL